MSPQDIDERQRNCVVKSWAHILTVPGKFVAPPRVRRRENPTPGHDFQMQLYPRARHNLGAAGEHACCSHVQRLFTRHVHYMCSDSVRIRSVFLKARVRSPRLHLRRIAFAQNLLPVCRGIAGAELLSLFQRLCCHLSRLSQDMELKLAQMVERQRGLLRDLSDKGGSPLGCVA